MVKIVLFISTNQTKLERRQTTTPGCREPRARLDKIKDNTSSSIMSARASEDMETSLVVFGSKQPVGINYPVVILQFTAITSLILCMRLFMKLHIYSNVLALS